MTPPTLLPHGLSVSHPEEWLTDSERFAGNWEGGSCGAHISLIVNEIHDPGAGAALHQHLYAEVSVIRSGHVRFTVGTTTIDAGAGAGQIIVAPPDVPHAFTNRGPGPLVMIDIDEHPTFTTRWTDTDQQHSPPTLRPIPPVRRFEP